MINRENFPILSFVKIIKHATLNSRSDLTRLTTICYNHFELLSIYSEIEIGEFYEKNIDNHIGFV
jgi:hypothetical protein